VKKLYKIGAFSKISNTPIQTLRYYDNLKLLRPNNTDLYSNYRYYTDEQLSKLNLIKRLKQIGFKLEEITKVMNNYDEKIFVNHKRRIQREINNKYNYIREIDSIIKQMKNKKQLSDLNNKEERNRSMKEKYNEFKESLLNCYHMYKNGKQDEYLVALEELKKKVFDIETETDPFWMEAAGDLFTGVVYELFKNNNKEDINFLNIFEFRINGKDNMDELTEYVNTLTNNSYSYLCLSSIVKAPKETRDSIIYVFKQKMKPFAMFDTNN